MSDYASAPVQPILQGVVSTDDGVPFFYGRGCSDIVVTGTSYILTLDSGSVGGSAGLAGVGGLDATFGRAVVTVRGTTSTVASKVVTYPTTLTIEVSFLDAGAAVVFPDAFEIIV